MNKPSATIQPQTFSGVLLARQSKQKHEASLCPGHFLNLVGHTLS